VACTKSAGHDETSDLQARPNLRTPRGKEERSGERELRRKIRELERALGRKTYELEIAGEALRGWE